MRPRRTASAAMAVILSSVIGTALAACTADRKEEESPPPPPSAVAEAECPKFQSRGMWSNAHLPGALPDDFTVDRFIWCAGEDAETYRQLETDQTGPILGALNLPSHPAHACSDIWREPILLLAAGRTGTYRAFIPMEGCWYRPDAKQTIESAPWRKSRTQPDR